MKKKGKKRQDGYLSSRHIRITEKDSYFEGIFEYGKVNGNRNVDR
jgi:hypothetical protein